VSLRNSRQCYSIGFLLFVATQSDHSRFLSVVTGLLAIVQFLCTVTGLLVLLPNPWHSFTQWPLLVVTSVQSVVTGLFALLLILVVTRGLLLNGLLIRGLLVP
jgi:hypothetical protein